MTRETKVGLLVGMGIILMIGIVVSDHLSQVQQQQPADLTQLNSQIFNTQGTSSSSLMSPASASASTSTPPSRIDPIPLAQELGRHPAASPPRPASASLKPKRIRRVEYMNEEQRLAQGVSSGQAAIRSTTSARGAFAGHRVPPQTARMERYTKPDPPMATAVVPRVSKAGIYHQVMRGQTLYSIAQRYYGQGDDWTLIRDANPELMRFGGVPQPGMQLRIPNKAISMRKHAQAVSAESSELPRKITVQAGQTLSGLAQKYLGKASAWDQLLEANRHLLTEPEELREGMVLVLPDRVRKKQTHAKAKAFTKKHSVSQNGHAFKSYEIQSGDTLSSLAGRFLGSQRQWHKLYACNKKIIGDPDNLKVGMKIRIPR